MRRYFLKFRVGDVEDPDWYANIELSNWAAENPEAHQYLMEKSDGAMRIHRHTDADNFEHRYEFTADMTEQDWFLYRMRFDNVS